MASPDQTCIGFVIPELPTIQHTNQHIRTEMRSLRLITDRLMISLVLYFSNKQHFELLIVRCHDIDFQRD